MRRLLVTAALLPALVACGGDDDTDSPPPDEPAPVVASWHADLKPIIDQRCNSCHVEGGPAPFTLHDFESMRAMAPAALASIESGRMPPWMPDPDCRHYQYERLMPAAEVDVLRQWIADGMPEGDPADAPATEKAAEAGFEPTHIAAPLEAYTPKAELSDDYRCFILDTEFETDTFLTASQVVPDADALVHHVLVYAMSEDALEAARTAEATEDGPGYTCFGGPFPTSSGGSTQAVGRGGGLPTQLGAWVPGSVPAIYDEDLAVPIPAGSKVVMQVHYNLLAGAPVADATTFEMRLTDTPPVYDVRTKPLVIHSLDIPAGEPYAENVRTYRNYRDTPVTITSVAAHMHLLGRRLTAVIEREDGADECLLDIPDWDFNWQQGYKLTERITLQPGESIRLTCAYDNSPENQAVVDGERREPVDVTWGEGTYDEMCMLYMTIIEPHQPGGETKSCEGATACFEACEATGRGAADCLIACPINTACKLCGLRTSATCGGLAACGALLAGLGDEPCVETCVINTMMLGGDTGACLADVCGEMYTELTACLDPVVAGEDCRAPFAETCGIVMPE